MAATWERGEPFVPFAARYLFEILVGTVIGSLSIAAVSFLWLLIAASDPQVLAYSFLAILAMGTYMSAYMVESMESSEQPEPYEDTNWVFEVIEKTVIFVMFNIIIGMASLLGYGFAVNFGPSGGAIVAMGYGYWELASVDREGMPIPLSIFAFTAYCMLALKRVSDTAEEAIEYLEFDHFSVQHIPVLVTRRIRRP